MKILVSGEVGYPDSFSKNIYVTLQEMGNEIKAVEPFLLSIKKPLNRILAGYAMRFFPVLERGSYNRLLKMGSEFQPDLILVAGGQGPPPSVIGDLKRRTKSKVVVWFPDYLGNFGREYVLAADYDAYFFKDQYIVEFFRDKLSKRAFLLPQACNPMWHRRLELTDEEKRKYGCDLTLAGNMYYYRALICQQFLDYNFKIWGNNYPRWLESPTRKIYQNHYIAEEEKAKAFSAAKIVLNMMHYGELLGVNLRTFEAAGCGAFQIVDWKPNLHEFFEPEKEVATFRTLGELKEKVRYYLEHDQERQEIADRGYRRAHADHTYEHRLRKLLALTFDESGRVDE